MERRKGGLELDSAHTQNMKNVGDLLRQRRKEMNLSLKEAENATSIRTAYLQALEDGEMHKLISPFMLKVFLNNMLHF